MNDDPTKRFEDSEDARATRQTVDRLYGLFTQFIERFNEFEGRVESKLLKQTSPLGETLEAIRADVANLKTGQDALNGRLESLETRLETLEARQSSLEAGQQSMKSDVAAIRVDVDWLKRTVRRVETKVNTIAIEITEIKGSLYNHEVRLEALEEVTSP